MCVCVCMGSKNKGNPIYPAPLILLLLYLYSHTARTHTTFPAPHTHHHTPFTLTFTVYQKCCGVNRFASPTFEFWFHDITGSKLVLPNIKKSPISPPLNVILDLFSSYYYYYYYYLHTHTHTPPFTLMFINFFGGLP